MDSCRVAVVAIKEMHYREVAPRIGRTPGTIASKRSMMRT
jgi:hypothetical protein